MVEGKANALSVFPLKVCPGLLQGCVKGPSFLQHFGSCSKEDLLAVSVRRFEGLLLFVLYE